MLRLTSLIMSWLNLIKRVAAVLNPEQRGDSTDPIPVGRGTRTNGSSMFTVSRICFGRNVIAWFTSLVCSNTGSNAPRMAISCCLKSSPVEKGQRACGHVAGTRCCERHSGRQPA
uniref:Uncharacterized protein n=1 Tax=Cupriavidus taiwanensis TaxID=164546 RepID=A0A375HE42_9BURK|nr:protein of unknown function [Cupriavidus taiwanensis]